MELKIIKTGSAGNCYILDNGNEALIIEAGVRFIEIKKALSFDIGRAVGCIVSHEHGDHSLSVKDLIKAGIQVHASAGTFEALSVGFYGSGLILNEKQQKQIGNFKIIPFKVEHDAKEPFGFLINHSETGNILFATDTKFLNYRFPGLNQIIIEANFSEEIIKENFNFVNQRVINSHLSLENCINFLNSNDLNNVVNIVLIHLSDRNSNEKQFRDKVFNETNKIVHVANNNETINFNLIPF